MKLGIYIKKARSRLKLTQEQLQAQCGWGPGNSRIGNYESDSREPSLDDLETICTNLGIKVWTLVQSAEESNLLLAEPRATYEATAEITRLNDAALALSTKVPAEYFSQLAASLETLANTAHFQK